VISSGNDTVEFKVEAMRAARIHVCESRASLGSTMVKALG
jgi:succinyl-CoA synthetase alpha subunit